MEFKPKKDNWHKQKMRDKRKFTKFKPQNSTDSNSTRGIPTPVIDVADSSDDRYSKRSISSNWCQYESDPDYERNNDQNEQMKAADFEKLKNASLGSHFTFNSEKQWEIENDNYNCGYFTINLKLMKAGLSAIPFYRRMEYDSSMFSNEQLKRMNDEAEKKEKEYQNVLKNYEEDKQKKQIPKSPASSQMKKEIDGNSSKNDEIDDALNVTIKSVESVKLEDKNSGPKSELSNATDRKSDKIDGNSPAHDKKDDIQEWLDGILDE